MLVLGMKLSPYDPFYKAERSNDGGLYRPLGASYFADRKLLNWMRENEYKRREQIALMNLGDGI